MQISQRLQGPRLTYPSPPRREPIFCERPAPTVPESVQLSQAEDKGDKPARRLRRKLGLGFTAALSLAGALAGVAIRAGVPPAEAEHIVGYSGDHAMNYGEVTSHLLRAMDEAEVGTAYDTRELQHLAANEELSEEAQMAAQALLADAILMNSVDAAEGGSVDRLITAEDLKRFAAQEPDAGAFTFQDLASDLSQRVDDVSAFEYFDSLAKEDDAFSRDDLQAVLEDPEAPETFRELAGDFLEYENLFNGFDVAQAKFSPNLWDRLTGAQTLDGVISYEDLKEVRYSAAPEQGDQWTNADREALARIANGGELESDLFAAFRQTDRGNCATTAVIKAAIDQYGGRVLKSFKPNAQGGYDIVMQDGYQLSLTGEEMEAGATAAHYESEQPNDTRSYADLLFTVSAKRAQLESHEGATTFSQALLSLNNGERTLRVPRYLGLQHLVQRIELSEVANHDGVVVHGGGHAYYTDTVDGETVGDRWGTPTEFMAKTRVNEGDKSKGAYILVDG